MDENARAIDFRRYRPASVLVIDLVKHSAQEKALIQLIQKTMEQVFAQAVETLKVVDAHFNYTGDGYVCALVGDASARILDFLNATVPELQRRLTAHGQQFRAGIDFGLVHLSKNPLTGAYEHFDLPGIQAARLEHAADPGQILCTEAVRTLFYRHYPELFSATPRGVETKDRTIVAYEIMPLHVSDVRDVFSAYLFRKGLPDVLRRMEKKILFVDDDTLAVEVMSEILKIDFPQNEIVTSNDALSAMKIYRPGEFGIVITDLMMPGPDGNQLTEWIIAADPDQVVIALTAMDSSGARSRFFSAGGSYYLTKPIDRRKFARTIRLFLEGGGTYLIRTRLQVICEDVGGMLSLLQLVAEELERVLAQVADPQDLVHSLLRHKAKQVVRDFVDRVGPGTDVVESLSAAKVQLGCVGRLAKLVRDVKVPELHSYLDEIVGDLRTLNPGIELSLSRTGNRDTGQAIPFGSAVVLIICELIDNAVGALNGSGRIETTISVLERLRLLQIVVRDTGPGIPENLVGSVFEEGISTKGPGRGLGLTLVREAVQLLRGEIAYEHDHGTVFRVKIPLVDEEAPYEIDSQPV